MKKIILVSISILIILISGCTGFFKSVKDDPIEKLNSIKTYKDWIDLRIKAKKKSGFNQLKASGKILVQQEEKKEVSVKFGLLLEDNGDEGLGIYKGMGLLLRYQVKGGKVTFTTEGDEGISEMERILPGLVLDIRRVFLPKTELIEEVEREELKKGSLEVHFKPQKVEREDENLILSKYIVFHYDQIKELGYFDEITASSYLSMKFLNYEKSELFAYPSLIIVYYPDLDLMLKFQITQFEYKS